MPLTTKQRKLAGATLLPVALGLAAWGVHRPLRHAIQTPQEAAASNTSQTRMSRAVATRQLHESETKVDAAKISSKNLTHSLRYAGNGSMAPLDFPLASQLPDLENRASHGDTAAGVQLWYGLEQCHSITSRSETDFLRNAEPNDVAKFVASDAKMLENCKGIAVRDINERYSWLKRAAELGNPKAQLFYARAGTDAIGGVDEALRNPSEWADYKNTATTYLMQLTEQCDPYAISTLWYAYRNGDQLFAPDPQKNFFYTSIGELISPSTNTPVILARATASLSQRQVANLETAANTFFQSHCQ